MSLNGDPFRGPEEDLKTTDHSSVSCDWGPSQVMEKPWVSAGLFPGSGQLFLRFSFKTERRASSMVARAPSSAALGKMPAGVSHDFLGVPVGKTTCRVVQALGKFFSQSQG